MKTMLRYITKIMSWGVFMCGCWLPVVASAQQNVQRKRSHSVFLYPQFQSAKVLQSFGRSVTDSINISLKDGALLFLRDGKVMEANLKGVLGAIIDGTEFKKVGNALGKVLGRDGYNYLVGVTMVDMPQYKAETQGGDKLPYFDLNDGAVFLELNRNEYESEKGLPLMDKYFFWLKGEVVPANETSVKPYVRPEMREAFKRLMADRWWSWQDVKSLQQLFPYFAP